MILILLFLPVFSAWSFPELVRYGYPNCVACHVSPSGGGVLNQYGRELSKEILSTWGAKGEQYFAYGLVKTPQNVNLQAYVRLLQLHRETPSIKEGRAILMQADLEGSYRYKNVTAVATLGRQEKQVKGEKVVQPISRRHYLLWQATDKATLRGGKFARNFGLNTPYHTSFVYRDLGFGQDTETYNLELSYIKDNMTFFYTAVLGAYQDKTTYASEKANTISFQYSFLKSQKVGATYYKGKDDNQERDIIGPWLILNYNKNLFLMSELFFQDKENLSSKETSKGYVNTNRFNYQIFKGVIPFLTFEASQLDWTTDFSKRQSYGAGLQFFPRPHIELMASYQKDRYYIDDGYFSDLYWFMFNYYL
ncbi:MAG: hypothetical protein K2P81_08500 [Bacteriovoracaceae bacterium]|nr:hypothetical protein [Bacteriovoracaceae bacterium]